MCVYCSVHTLDVNMVKHMTVVHASAATAFDKAIETNQTSKRRLPKLSRQLYLIGCLNNVTRTVVDDEEMIADITFDGLFFLILVDVFRAHNIAYIQ